MTPLASTGRVIPGTLRQEAAPVQVQLRRVLVVDDALPVRRKLQESLARAGIEAAQVRVAKTADEALAVFVMEHADLVFAELVGEDPQEGLRMILEMLHIDPRARIVLVTGEDPTGPLVRQAIRCGVFGVVEKPLRNDKIRQVLAEIESEDGGIERFR